MFEEPSLSDIEAIWDVMHGKFGALNSRELHLMAIYAKHLTAGLAARVVEINKDRYAYGILMHNAIKSLEERNAALEAEVTRLHETIMSMYEDEAGESI